MKRLNITSNLTICVLVVLFVSGCAKKEQPRLESVIERGNAFQDKGQYDQAISDFNKAIEINPRLADAFYNRGNAYFKKGQPDKAISDYNKAIELNPKLAMAYYDRGIAYQFKGQYDQAISDFF